MPGLLGKFVTCTYEPPRAAGAPVATMDDPPAALLRFPPSASLEDLRLPATGCCQTCISKVGGSSQDLEVIWDIGKEGRF